VVLMAIVLLAALPAVGAAGHRHGGWYGGWYGGPYWGGPYWGGYWGPAWGGYTVVYPMVDRTHGALDLDVSPERAQIYVDGELVGEADDFDGFPDFLWLEKGTYDVVIFHAGYQTIARQYSIYGGQVIDVEDRMTPGQETRPEDLASKSTVNREERLRRERETQEEAERNERAWQREAQAEGEYEELDARREPGRAVVRVTPDDASIYLDGRFLGTGWELSRLRSGLIVDAGDHEIEAVRPGLEPESRRFTVEPGAEVEVVLELEPED
jgi:hypothetical protein